MRTKQEREQYERFILVNNKKYLQMPRKEWTKCIKENGLFATIINKCSKQDADVIFDAIKDNMNNVYIGVTVPL